MRDRLGNILIGFIWIAIILMSSGFAISFGYFFYLWGSILLPINVAAWMAFILWLKLELVGFLLLMFSFIALSFL
jgi:hypothetical protein